MYQFSDIEKRYRFILVISIFLFISYTCTRNNTVENVHSGQQEMFALLHEWCDGLLLRQVQHSDTLLHGGILCPACALMHGRSPDAIYPFLYVASCTGESKYVDAAKKLFTWGERNVRFSDGSWNNEVNIYTWRGITVFGLITLTESLRDFSSLLDLQTRNEWMKSVHEQADFVMSYIKPGVGNINYSATACYALALAGELTGERKYTEKAAELAALVSSYFTENDFLLYGEGTYPYVKSAKGLFPVDLGYNVEESLPNLLLYADLVKDSALKSKIEKSIRTQIEFMLPDGAWDNSWGTRNFKWSYWGSRTSDGVVSLCSVLANEDSLYETIGYRNVQLLQKCTHDGLLYGGMHYRSACYPACIHHTFEHAKGLAVALHNGLKKPATEASLPREEEYGSRYFEDLDIWLLAVEDWRATVSGYDTNYKQSGGNTHGGALSLLWHKSAGPILAAAMTEYSIIEPGNMQLLKGQYNYSPTCQVIYEENGVKYSNANCKAAEITCRSIDFGKEVVVNTELVDMQSNQPYSGKMPVEITYGFVQGKMTIKVVKKVERDKRTIGLYMPVISQANEKSGFSGTYFEIIKPDATISIHGNGNFEQLPVEKNGRAFCPVPGFEFVPLYVKSAYNLEVSIACK